MKHSEASQLLEQADREGSRLRRHLLVAAALDLALTHRPVVVGGTAEEYWTNDDYTPTDLDVCVPLTSEDERCLAELGFERDGRHWTRGEEHPIAVEFPEDRIEGDERRVVERAVGSVMVRVIGLEDLYLDRVRLATATPDAQSDPFNGALAIAAARDEEMDWKYVAAAIRETSIRDEMLGRAMSMIDRRVRTRVRRELGSPDD